jgi:hypothetical protein
VGKPSGSSVLEAGPEDLRSAAAPRAPRAQSWADHVWDDEPGDFEPLLDKLQLLTRGEIKGLLAEIQGALSEAFPETDRRSRSEVPILVRRVVAPSARVAPPPAPRRPSPIAIPIPAPSRRTPPPLRQTSEPTGRVTDPQHEVTPALRVPSENSGIVVEPRHEIAPLLRAPSPPTSLVVEPAGTTPAAPQVARLARRGRVAKSIGTLLVLTAIIIAIPWRPTVRLDALFQPVTRYLKPAESGAGPNLVAGPSAAAQIPPATALPVPETAAVASSATKTPEPTETVTSVNPTAAMAVRPKPASSIAATIPAAPQDVDTLIARGDYFLRRGDVIAARSFYERGANAGSAVAATKVATTFDPAFLLKIGAVGVRGDATQAAFWYRKAEEAGK